MPRLSSWSKHEEFESNSTLQITFRRKEGAEAKKEDKQRISHQSAKISHHGAKILHWCEISFPEPLFLLAARFCFFFTHMVFSPFYPPCIMLFEGMLIFYLILSSI